jgi:hypothetical protein
MCFISVPFIIFPLSFIIFDIINKHSDIFFVFCVLLVVFIKLNNNVFSSINFKDKEFIKKIFEEFYSLKLIDENTLLFNLIKTTKSTQNTKNISECLLMISNIIKERGNIIKGTDIKHIAKFVNSADKDVRESSLVCLSFAYKF